MVGWLRLEASEPGAFWPRHGMIITGLLGIIAMVDDYLTS
jgi:hypothetical protein